MERVYLITLSVVSIITLLLVLRFVHPQAIHAVRKSVSKAQMTRAFIIGEEGRILATDDVRRLLLSEPRLEGSRSDQEYINGRLLKIREAYRLTANAMVEGKDVGETPRYILGELSDLLGIVGTRIQANSRVKHPVLSAKRVALLLVAQICAEEKTVAPRTLAEMQTWLTSRGLSLEQCFEILIAAVIMLSTRPEGPASPPTPAARASGGTRPLT